MNNQEFNEELENIITLQDENGEDTDFELLDVIDYEGKEYIVLIPVEDEDGNVLILEVETDGDEESYATVDDEEILNAVFEIFKENFKDEFNFVD